MKAKTTQTFLKLNPFCFFVLGIVFSANTIGFAQNVTDIFPTRITTKSKVTINGSGFTTAIANSITIANIGVANRELVSTTEMIFEITSTGSTTLDNMITITGVTYDTGVDTSFDYIRPKSESLTNSKDFFVKEIYTNWDYDGNGFWRSNDWVSGNINTWPNNKHELLGFKMHNGTIFSTGVDDVKLLAELPVSETDDPGEFYASRYKAYSTNGVQGKTNSGHYILTGDLVDGLVGSAENATNNDLTSLNEIEHLTIFDVIIDGKNGLELGTGISNFNKETSVRFFSGNGQPGTFGDDYPDLLITQIAQAGGTDIYFYADERGNVVGTPIKLSISTSGSTQLAKWQLDLFSFPTNQPIVSTNPNKRGFINNDNEHRPIRMIAFKLEDFDIDDNVAGTGYIGNVNNINMMAGGTADLAFLAYNAATFDIKSPLADPLLSKFICKVDGTSNVTFNVNAGVDDGNGNLVPPSPSANPDETLTYLWSKYNIPAPPNNTDPAFTISNVSTSELATYKVKVSNANGTIILPVTLSEGGTPTFWNGSSWQSPFGVVADEERALIFSSSYNISGDLKGCDCTVTAGNNVFLPSGSKMVLYDELTVQPAIPAGPENSYVPKGNFTLEDDASLVQIKPVTSNINSGPIKMKRQASGLHANDYVFWSSPVEGFEHANIPGNLTFEWDTNFFNSGNNTEGNWVSPSTSTMTAAKGYIKRVPSAANITAEFIGKPINGEINIAVNLTTAAQNSDDSDWNLIGNPYPSAINAVEFLKLPENNSIEGAVYLWTHYTAISSTPNPADSPFYQNFAYNYGDQYLTHNELGTSPSGPGGTSFNGNIAAGQSFFVKALSNANVSFKNELRYDSSENAYDNTNFFRSGSETAPVSTSEKQLIWLSLVKDNSIAVSTLVGYAENATYGKDRMFDAQTTSEAFAIYSMVANDKMIIQGRPLPFDNSDTVTLGVSIPENGIYKIGIDKLEGSMFVDQAQPIYLEDIYLNIVHDLRESPYAFTEVAATVNDRFLLRFTPSETLAVNETLASKTFAFIKNSELKVRSSHIIKGLQIYDLNGKQVASYEVEGNRTAFDVDFQFAKGLYLALITLENDSVIKKKLMN